MQWRALRNFSVIVTSAVYAVMFTVALFAGLFGIVLFWLSLLSIWRYCYVVLRAVAQGQWDIPPPTIESMNFFNDLAVTAHFLSLAAALLITYRLLPWGLTSVTELVSLALLAAIVFVIPASAALMGLTGNFFAALSPAAVAALIGTLGRDYWILVGACIGLVLLSALAQALVIRSLGLVAILPIVALATWTLLALFALTGSAIHAHRHAFEIPGSKLTREERSAIELRSQWRATLDLAYASIRGGLVAEGYQTLRRLIAENPGLDIQYWLFDQMLEWEDRRHASRLGARLIERLVHKRDMPAAFEVYLRCRRYWPTELPISNPTASVLSRYALEIGQTGRADEIVGRADSRPSTEH